MHTLTEPPSRVSRTGARCWFYFGRTVELGQTFVCSSDPDPQLSAFQNTPTLRPYTYGRFDMYLSAAGNGSLWFGISEQYKYAMVTNFYTCGVTVQPLDSTTVGCRQFDIRAQRGGEATSCAYSIAVGFVGLPLSRSVFSVFIQHTQRKSPQKLLATFHRWTNMFPFGHGAWKRAMRLCDKNRVPARCRSLLLRQYIDNISTLTAPYSQKRSQARETHTTLTDTFACHNGFPVVEHAEDSNAWRGFHQIDHVAGLGTTFQHPHDAECSPRKYMRKSCLWQKALSRWRNKGRVE